MSIGTTATFTTAGPHAAVVQANGEEIGRARFYVDGRPSRTARIGRRLTVAS